MNRHHVRRGLAAVAVLVLQGCGGAGGGDTGAGGGASVTGPATAALFCEAYADAFVQRYAECSKASLPWVTEFIQKSLICGRINYAVDNGLATYDARAAGRCLDFFQSATCAEVRGFRDDVVFVAGCSDAVKGKGAKWAPCKSDYECASARCDTTLPSPTCQPAYTSLGPCNFDRDCGPGWYCYRGTLWYDRSCQPFVNRPGLDQPCSEGTGCQAGLQCEGSSTFDLTGLCKPQKTGATCTMEEGLTALGYGCLGGTVQPLVGPGQPCTVPDDCGPGLYCGSSGTDFVCLQEPVVGEACDFSDPDKLCIGGYCNSFGLVCVAEPRLTWCFSDWDCDSEGYCESGCNKYTL